MRKIICENKNWSFSKTYDTESGTWKDQVYVDLPHTPNGEDGQDGGGDYFRGKMRYAKKIKKSSLPKSEEYYLEVCGANSAAEVYINKAFLFRHEGGYSKFRVRLTDSLTEDSLLEIFVDNSHSDKIYPQVADFTFYGGLYRDVNIICVPKSHFALEYSGTPGIKITPILSGADAEVTVDVFLENEKVTEKIRYTATDADGKELISIESINKTVKFNIRSAHLWDGVNDPYLYTMRCELIDTGVCIDTITSKFGIRDFRVDADRGFFLNDRHFPLRGVSRHQDRPKIGNAIKNTHHEEDISLILEMGANALRLAHYQHDDYFYTLCDEKGLIVWAEIPYISKHSPEADENAISQMKELIIQNYNHPSIAFWGLSNEITMNGADDEDLIREHQRLNDLVHELDKTRLTAIAALSVCPTDAKYLSIPDLVAYNHYFGWYGGNVDSYASWFDEFHKKYPKIPIGCSEYGCEALNWHTSAPEAGDYTEEYQAYYHEALINQLFSRDYLFATYVWNMFDFAADARAEGGENGMNHKGLVSFDRKYKKDSFFAYKARLSKEPFIHIAGKRYKDRAENTTRVTVYSNLPKIDLYLNGVFFRRAESSDGFFHIEIPLTERSELYAVMGDISDSAVFRRVEKFNEDYRLKEKNAVLNWFEISAPEGYLSLNDKIRDIEKSEEGKAFLMFFFSAVKEKANGAFAFEMNESMKDMLSSFTLLRLSGMLGMMNASFDKDELLLFNKRLNEIKKAKN